MTTAPRILLLGGTAEARSLAARLAERRDVDVVVSLAGATMQPYAYPTLTRVGGFGGAAGLADYLREQAIALVVDATHPFAVRISDNAAGAARIVGVPLVRLVRPPWMPGGNENWRSADSLAAAVDALPSAARAFLATGRGTIRQLAELSLARDDIWCAIRVIDPPDDPFPLSHGRFVVDRPPFPKDEEYQTFSELKITHLVARNAGGTTGRAKLDAAGELGLAVTVIDRPKPEIPAVTVPYVEDVERWIDAQLRG